MNEVIRLAGGLYEILPGPTLQGEIHWRRCLWKGGLHNLHLHPSETVEEYEARARGRLLESGVALRLLATLLTPLQEPWTAERAGFVPGTPLPTTTDALERASTEDAEALEVLFRRLLDRVAGIRRTPGARQATAAPVAVSPRPRSTQ